MEEFQKGRNPGIIHGGKTVDDGIFRALPEMIAPVSGSGGGLNL